MQQTQTTEPEDDTIYRKYVEHNGKQYGLVTVAADVITYRTFEELEKNSEYVVIGEFINEETSVIVRGELPQSAQKGTHVLDWYCYNQFKISQVLKGDISEEIIEITGTYAYDDEKDMLYQLEGSMCPLNKGGKYIYFLRKKGSDGRYCSCGDPSGRYPYMEIDEDKLEQKGYSEDELGIDSVNVFQYQLYPIYKEMVEFYNISFD